VNRSFFADARGAVIAEFMVAVTPFLMIFFATAQFSTLSVAKLLTQHAAFTGARAAMVVCSDPQGQGDAQGTIQRAATLAYGPAGSVASPTATISGGCDAVSQGPVTVQVTTNFPCSIPLGNLLVCQGTSKTLTATATMPNQGSQANAIWGGGGK